jgi:hypothetical protein
MAIRTRPPESDDPLTTGLKELFEEEAPLSSDAFEYVSLRDDEPSDEELLDLVTPVALGSSPSDFRFLLGNSHTSFRTTSAIDHR